jgi:hypothetical protein
MTGTELREYVAAGCGFVPDDQSSRNCGDCNGSGNICFMYLKGQKRCAILGNKEITPSMTCVLQTTGDPLPDDYTPQELVTPTEVGLVDTGPDGATCKFCDWSEEGEAGPVCGLLTKIQALMAGLLKVKDADAKFKIDPGACCSCWKRDGVENPVT